MGLYINLASVVSAVCDKTGDDSQDAQVKIRRLVNEKGPDFIKMTNWPFMRTDISFSITSSAYTYSGASYLPETFHKIVAAHIQDSSSKWYPVIEANIKRRYTEWLNPDDNQGRPKEFCVTRIESGYYEIQFDRLPDDTYTFYADIEQKWVPLTSTTANLLITDDYLGAFSLYVSKNRALQQGDSELYATLDREWFNPQNPKQSVFGSILAALTNPMERKQITPLLDIRSTSDYA